MQEKAIMLKLKGKIIGEKVHDVGYRVFLLRKALELGIKGFNAYNDFEDGQILQIQAEGEDSAIQSFKNFANKKAPENALISQRSFDDYHGFVMSISDYMHLLQVEQLNKGIPAIISIDKKQDRMLEKQDRMLEKQDSMLEKQDSVIKEIKDVSHKIDLGREEITSEIHSLRDDLKSHFDERLSKMESELFEIKSRVDTIQYLSPSKMSSKAQGEKAR
jgi:acylphosphatase